MHIAVFLDRDGTINEEMGYINHLDRFVLLPSAAVAIRRINESGLKAVVITNQAGAARGYFSVDLIDQVHRKMCRLLEEEGALKKRAPFWMAYTRAPMRRQARGSQEAAAAANRKSG
jgi:histidinol-phosphate phosphatase family protein